VQWPVPAPTTTLEVPEPEVVTLLEVFPLLECTVTEFGPVVEPLTSPLLAVTVLDIAPPGGVSPGLR